MNRWLMFVFAVGGVFPVLSEKLAGMLLDYRNSFLSYEQKGLDTCPITYFQETCTDYAHIVGIEVSATTDTTLRTSCLGVIINEQYIMTTASCVPVESPRSIKLRANFVNAVSVSSIFLHPDYNLAQGEEPAINNLALLMLNTTLSFNKNVAACCLWASDSVDMYSKIQDVYYNNDKLVQNTTICSGIPRNECLKSVQQRWCEKESSTGILQIRELGQYKMHPMIASFGCNTNGEVDSISNYLPWIREVTKSTHIEYNLTDTGLGERCFNPNNSTGVCLPIENCPQVVKHFKSLQKNNTISMCGFEGNKPLTCCTTEDMLYGPETETLFRDVVQEIEECEYLYDAYRRTPEEHQLNSQVAVIDLNDSVNCSSTLITARFLLSSAQCVLNINVLKNTSIWLGLGDDFENVAQKNEIKSIFTHPKFNPKTNFNNVAVIQLRNPVLIQAFSVPACLWREQTKLPTNLEAVSYNSDGDIFSVTASLPMYYSDCRRLHNSDLIPSELCVHRQFRPECGPLGDSCQTPGSGLYSNLYFGEDLKPVTYVTGIYSNGYQCDKSGPAIYTRVSKYYEWIKSVVYLNSQYVA